MKCDDLLHRWDLTVSEAIALQRELATKVISKPLCRSVKKIVGLDAAFDEHVGQCYGVAVLWDVKCGEVLEVAYAVAPINFPYVPGLLSFREVPVLLKALYRLRGQPDLLLCDGQGIAHPRRFGLASHLGVIVGMPSIGCAKSRLIGTYEEPEQRRGATSILVYKGEPIGAVVRTRDKVRPVYVSIGHLITLPEAIQIVLSCARGYRVPEPTRIADHLVRQLKAKGRL